MSFEPFFPPTKRPTRKFIREGHESTRADLDLAKTAALAAEVCFLKPGRLISPPGTYFVTFSTWQRRRLFVVENCARLLLTIIYQYRHEGRFQLHAFVLMPEHVHLLLTPANNLTLEHAVQLIKGGYSHALGGMLGRRREIWQRGFTDHRIRDEPDFLHHQTYIHQNPVERGLVTNASEYRYCSVFPGFKLDPWTAAAKAKFSKSA